LTTHQPGILDDVPSAARYVTLQLAPDADPKDALVGLRDLVSGHDTVVGLGYSTVARAKGRIEALREPPCFAGSGIAIPAVPAALWLWLRGSDRGELVHRTRRLLGTIADAFATDTTIDAFMYEGGRDLTGYKDGTENPAGADAAAAAFLSGAGPGLDGSSFVAVQTWVHDLGRFGRFAPAEQDAIIGRRRSDDVEIEDAPASAHVKRTAQGKTAFVLRRSMPWNDGRAEGLVFVAFGRSFDAFEAQLRRMIGLEDGITDGLFRFSRPVSTSYFWCPPVKDGKLDLRALGL